MKKIFLLASVVTLAVLVSSFVHTTQGKQVMFKMVASSSSITWTSKADDGTSHTGNLKFKSGNLKFDSETLLSGYSFINMQSLSCSDVADEGFNRELIVEMRSPEQLNLAKYKDATFKIVKAKRLDVADGKPNYKVDGIVKMKGLELPVEATVIIKKSKKGATLKGGFTLSKDQTNLPYDLDLKVVMTTKLQ